MLDQPIQYDKSHVDSIPENLKREIKEFYMAVRHALFYPPKHPIRVKSATEIWKSFQRSLSHQESHSLTAIKDKLHIDQCAEDGSKKTYTVSDGMSIDLARRFRRRGIRSVTFSQGMELWELERLLEVVTMRSKDMVTQSSASEILHSSEEDVSHIEIVDIEYENIQFASSESEGVSMNEEEMLIAYLRGESETLADSAYTYLLSLLEEPDLLAHLIEDSVYYDGIHEPDSATLNGCMENLVNLGEQSTDEARRDFQKKVLETILRMENPVKSALFFLRDDSGMMRHLMEGLSVDETAELMSLECITDESPVMVRRMFDEMMMSYLDTAPGSLEERLEEIETAVRDRLIEGGQEEAFNNRFIPILEQVFVDLGIFDLEGKQLELGNFLNELYSSGQKEASPDEMSDLFAAEDGIVSLAFVLLEMLEFETDAEIYSEVFSRLEEIVRSLIMRSQDSADAQVQNLTAAFHIIDSFFDLANSEGDRPTALKDRAVDAISNIGTEKIINQVLSISLRSEQLELEPLKRFIQQMGEKAVTPLIGKLLDVETSGESLKLRRIIVSVGSIIVPELHELLSQCPWSLVAEYIVPALGEIGGTEALDCLADALSHSQPQVRASAVKALMKIRTPGAVELVLSRIRDDAEEEYIRQLAILTLGEMGNGQAVEEIGKIIKKKDPTFKREAIQALGGIGGDRSISILADILNQKRLIFGRRRIEELQLHAVEALSQIGTQPAVKVMAEMSRKKRGNVKSALDRALLSHDYDLES